MWKIGRDRFHHGDTGKAEDEAEDVVAFIHISAASEDGFLHGFDNRVSDGASSFAEVVVRGDAFEFLAFGCIIGTKGAVKQFTKTARDVKFPLLRRSWNFEVKDIFVQCWRSKDGSIVDELFKIELRFAEEFGKLGHDLRDLSRGLEDVLDRNFLRYITAPRRGA